MQEVKAIGSGGDGLVCLVEASAVEMDIVLFGRARMRSDGSGVILSVALPNRVSQVSTKPCRNRLPA
ncbi:hypothetical protein BLNAU_10714 [Blattamonas nauphoetae]|uniref:Uncharacterized protein n=1 Tax=Blattamonas nauphoetae TaxID=2049346 RepID=A0ABQ9XPM8_9EUKA|nr:hypothetical protein BLNAU_10714 [Blattamonas nauphoetae]